VTAEQTPALSARCVVAALGLAAVLALLLGETVAQERHAPTGPDGVAGAVRLLNYNVHGLPPLVTGDNSRARLRAIAASLEGFDVVALQENFVLGPRLDAWVAFPHRVHATARRWPRPATAGLSTLGHLEVQGSDFIPFVHCHGTLTSANDCLSNKGALFSRLVLDTARGLSFDLYNLHLDAGNDDGDADARRLQAEVLHQAIQERSAGRAVVVVGDINEKRGEGKVGSTLSSLGLRDVCTGIPCPGDPRIERFLVRSGSGVKLEPHAWQIESRFVDDEGEPLSDHPAIALTLHWSNGVQSEASIP